MKYENEFLLRWADHISFPLSLSSLVTSLKIKSKAEDFIRRKYTVTISTVSRFEECCSLYACSKWKGDISVKNELLVTSQKKLRNSHN